MMFLQVARGTTHANCKEASVCGTVSRGSLQTVLCSVPETCGQGTLDKAVKRLRARFKSKRQINQVPNLPVHPRLLWQPGNLLK